MFWFDFDPVKNKAQPLTPAWIRRIAPEGFPLRMRASVLISICMLFFSYIIRLSLFKDNHFTVSFATRRLEVAAELEDWLLYKRGWGHTKLFKFYEEEREGPASFLL